MTNSLTDSPSINFFNAEASRVRGSLPAQDLMGAWANSVSMKVGLNNDLALESTLDLSR